MHKEYIFENKSCDTVILFIHGILGSPNQFLDFIHALKSQFSIVNLLLPGHGKGGDDFAKSSMEQWVDYVNSAVLKLQSQYENIIIVSHSMGGLFAIESAIANPQKIRGLFMLGLPLYIKLNLPGIRIGFKVVFKTMKKTDIHISAIKNGYSIENKTFLCYFRWIPHFWALYKKGHHLRSLIKRITIPTICFQSKHDEYVSRRSNKHLRHNPNITLYELQKSGHFYYEKSDQEEILTTFLEFVSLPFSNTP